MSESSSSTFRLPSFSSSRPSFGLLSFSVPQLLHFVRNVRPLTLKERHKPAHFSFQPFFLKIYSPSFASADLTSHLSLFPFPFFLSHRPSHLAALGPSPPSHTSPPSPQQPSSEAGSTAETLTDQQRPSRESPTWGNSTGRRS